MSHIGTLTSWILQSFPKSSAWLRQVRLFGARFALFTLAGLVLSAGPAQADPTVPCPASGTTQSVGLHTLSTYKQMRPHALETAMAPCETIEVWLNGTAHATQGSILLVELVSETGIVLSKNDSLCRSSCAIRVPYPAHGVWGGTRGPAGLVDHVRVTLNGGMTIPNPTYNLTIIRTPRPGYNVGGLGISDAPLLPGLPTQVRGSFVKEEVGQYFKVRLTGSGTLRVSGTGYTSWYYGTTLVVHVHKADGTFTKEILRKPVYGSTTFASTTFTSTSAEPAEFYVRVYLHNSWPSQYAYGYWLNDLDMTVEGQAAPGPFLKAGLDGGPLAPAAGVIMPTTAHVPLGSFVTFAVVDQQGSPITATFRPHSHALAPGVDANSLFPNHALFSYALRDQDKIVLQAIHLGQATVDVVTPAESPYPSQTFRFTVIVELPQALGSTAPQVDDEIYPFAHRFGIPPNYLKGQIEVESNFVRTTYRYEPIGNIGDWAPISRGRNYRRATSPYQEHRFETWADAQDFALQQGAKVSADDLAAAGLPPSPRHGQLLAGCNAQTRGHPITSADLPISVLDVISCNDRTMHWGDLNGQQRLDGVWFDPFTAQLSLASSFGYMQVSYIAAVDRPFSWSGVMINGQLRQNPSLLFDTAANLAAGAGSLPLGCRMVAHHFRRATPLGATLATNPNDAIDEPLFLMSHFKDAWHRYNLRDNYEDEVAVATARYSVRPSRPIF